MKLMTKNLAARFKELGDQNEVEDPIVVAQFTYPNGVANFYAIEYVPKENEFFGLCILKGGAVKWGYASLAELTDYRSADGQCVKRVLHHPEFRISGVYNPA